MQIKMSVLTEVAKAMGELDDDAIRAIQAKVPEIDLIRAIITLRRFAAMFVEEGVVTIKLSA